MQMKSIPKLNRTRVLATACGVTAIALVSLAATAEPAFVSDQFLLGVHAQRSLDSAIVEILPSGSPLEVFRLDSGLAEVRTESGETGWVDQAYLTAEPPAATRVKELEARLSLLQQELAQGLATGTGCYDSGDGPLTDTACSALNEELAETEQSRDAALSALETQRAASAAREQDLSTQLASLTEELAATQTANHRDPTRLDLLLTQAPAWLPLALVAGVALCGFIGGSAWQQRRTRRRFGGFRF